MAQDRPLLGILLMLGFCLMAPMGDAMAKLLGATMPLLQLLIFRFAVQTAILAPLAFRAGVMRLSRRVVLLSAVRTGLHILGIGAMFLSLRFLPLADAVAIAFVMPFIMLLLGRFVLGETVGPRRLAACAVGFAGTLLVVQPSFAEVGAPALLPLFVALAFSLFMLTTRRVAKEADPIALQFVSGLIAAGGLLAVWAVLGGIHPDLTVIAPGGRDMAFLVGIGVLGTLAHLLMTWSLRFAPSATLAPMQYLEIPVATMIGWLVFGDLPNGLAAVGIAVTAASGLYVIQSERSGAGRA
ncbi:MAG: DMT family transporter [Pikeienuella sp.]